MFWKIVKLTSNWYALYDYSVYFQLNSGFSMFSLRIFCSQWSRQQIWTISDPSSKLLNMNFIQKHSLLPIAFSTVYQNRCTNIHQSPFCKMRRQFWMHLHGGGSNENFQYIFRIRCSLFVNHKFIQMINIRPINFASVYTLYRRWIFV